MKSEMQDRLSEVNSIWVNFASPKQNSVIWTQATMRLQRVKNDYVINGGSIDVVIQECTALAELASLLIEHPAAELPLSFDNIGQYV